MKLQLALDRLEKSQCFKILEETKDSVDIIEIGTGVIKEYGMQIVCEVKNRYPDKEILADMKTCDAGKYETLQAIHAGADITTVMAFAANNTISDCLRVAEKNERIVMIDLLEVRSKERIAELKDLGVKLVCLHIGKDSQKDQALSSELFSLVKGFNFQVAVAGGINLETLPLIVAEKPDIVIVGSAITKHPNPKDVAREIKKMISQS